MIRQDSGGDRVHRYNYLVQRTRSGEGQVAGEPGGALLASEEPLRAEFLAGAGRLWRDA